MKNRLLCIVASLVFAVAVLFGVQSYGTSYVESVNGKVQTVSTGNVAKADWSAPCWRIRSFKYGAHNHWNGPYPYKQHRYINHGVYGNGYLVEWQTWVRPKYNPWGWKYSHGAFRVQC